MAGICAVGNWCVLVQFYVIQGPARTSHIFGSGRAQMDGQYGTSWVFLSLKDGDITKWRK